MGAFEALTIPSHRLCRWYLTKLYGFEERKAVMRGCAKEWGNPLWQSWRLIFSIALGFAIVSYIIALLIQPLWRATAIIEVAIVPIVNGQREIQQIPIEPQAELERYMRIKSVMRSLLSRGGLSQAEVEMYLSQSRIKVLPVPGTRFMEVKVNSPSPEEAERIVDVIVDFIVVRHEQKKRELLTLFGKQLGVGKVGQGDCANILQSRAEATDGMEGFLCRTRTARLGEIEVSDGPVSPNRGVIVLFSALFGLVSAILFVSWQCRRNGGIGGDSIGDV